MSWSQLLLLVAILAVFLLWRRARHQVRRARADIESHRARNTFTFDVADDGPARRFVVRDAAGAEVAPERLSWSEHGLEAIPGTPAPAAATDLEPGTGVELIDDEEGVGVWNRELTRRLGRVDPAGTPAARRRLDEGELGSCVILRHAPGALTLLLIHAGVDVDA